MLQIRLGRLDVTPILGWSDRGIGMIRSRDRALLPGCNPQRICYNRQASTREECWMPPTAHSSSGPGHRPLKAEIRGSNPLCATKNQRRRRYEQPSAFSSSCWSDLACRRLRHSSLWFSFWLQRALMSPGTFYSNAPTATRYSFGGCRHSPLSAPLPLPWLWQ